MQHFNFPTWLNYGGLVCGLLLIGASVLYTVWRKRHAPPPLAETGKTHPPRRQPGIPAPFVYNAATPWGWLEYRNGNFLGQELALKRAIVSIGREADNEIELDDDTISRYHAELAWENGQVSVTDYGSLNGVLLNGQRIRASMPVKHGDLLTIGAHRFLMKFAQKSASLDDADDPLLKYVRRPAANQRSSGEGAPLSHLENQPVAGPTRALPYHPSEAGPSLVSPMLDIAQQATSLITRQKSQPEPRYGLCILGNGNLAGHCFWLDRSQLTIGRANDCEIVIDDASLSPHHARFSRQLAGDYVQDLASHYGSQVNGEPLHAPRLLRLGDVITLGNVRLEYSCVPNAQAPHIPCTPPESAPLNLPRALRLPSK